MSIIFLLFFKSINKTCDISKLLIVLKTLPVQKLFQFGEKNVKTKYTYYASQVGTITYFESLL